MSNICFTEKNIERKKWEGKKKGKLGFSGVQLLKILFVEISGKNMQNHKPEIFTQSGYTVICLLYNMHIKCTLQASLLVIITAYNIYINM